MNITGLDFYGVENAIFTANEQQYGKFGNCQYTQTSLNGHPSSTVSFTNGFETWEVV